MMMPIESNRECFYLAMHNVSSASHAERNPRFTRRARQSSSPPRWQAMCAQISGRSTSASNDATVVVAMPAAARRGGIIAD